MKKVLLRWRAVFGSGIFITLTVIGLESSAQAQSSKPLLNPANQHFYEAVTVSGGIDWFDAKVAAESRSFRGVQGHLVTITSEQEDVFIATNFPQAVTRDDGEGLFPYWYGGSQPFGSPTEEDWEWVTSEPFDYINWAVGEPNDFQGRDEDCLLPHGNPAPGSDPWAWNDAECDETRPLGYVVEYDKPLKQVIERPLLNPANQHFYEAVTVAEGIDWFVAKAAAESRSFRGVQGHLVTITSAQEDDFIATNFPEAFPVVPSPRESGCEVPITVANTCGFPYWFGGFQSPDSQNEPAGDWEWVTGEPFVYINWHGGEPNDFQSREEDCLNPHPDGSLGWNDSTCDDRRIGGYLIEYDKPNE